MNECERFAGEMEKALNGGAWHGPSWRELLDGVSLKDAHHRPIAQAHTIGEIVAHETAWHDIVRKRIEGGGIPHVSDAEDWPSARFATDAAWSAAVERLFESGRALTEAIRRFPPERLGEKRPGLDDPWYALISGQLQHVLYHAGQVGVLKKALARG
jgi:hypothetical protein